jgi:16S rRNA (uracil1498-N3)-methyltransferase
MPKFFVLKSRINNGRAVIEGEDALHISRVLRLGKGQSVTLCDGLGWDYDAVIETVSKNEITASIVKTYKCDAEPSVRAVLYQALPKHGKMEYVIQKTTELGVAKIVPVYSKRCVAKPSANQLTRWRKIAREAAKQSGRGIIPEVGDVISFDEAIGQMSRAGLPIMFYEEEQTVRLKDVIEGKRPPDVCFLIGPEGGFDPLEAQLARDSGIPTVTLGKRILRTETAAAAVLAIIMYSLNDL